MCGQWGGSVRQATFQRDPPNLHPLSFPAYFKSKTSLWACCEVRAWRSLVWSAGFHTQPTPYPYANMRLLLVWAVSFLAAGNAPVPAFAAPLGEYFSPTDADAYVEAAVRTLGASDSSVLDKDYAVRLLGALSNSSVAAGYKSSACLAAAAGLSSGDLEQIHHSISLATGVGGCTNAKAWRASEQVERAVSVRALRALVPVGLFKWQGRGKGPRVSLYLSLCFCCVGADGVDFRDATYARTALACCGFSVCGNGWMDVVRNIPATGYDTAVSLFFSSSTFSLCPRRPVRVCVLLYHTLELLRCTSIAGIETLELWSSMKYCCSCSSNFACTRGAFAIHLVRVAPSNNEL